MKIAVCVKHAVDETELRLDPGGRPVLAGAAGKMSTFDKNAVEEGLRLKSAHQGEVVVFVVGAAESKKTLKEALAMGADRGVIVAADPMAIDALRTARILAAAIKRSGPYDVVLCSEGASDTYTGQVPPMLGELLGVAYVGYARKIEVTGQSARVERSLEDSVEVIEAPVPFAASVVSEINEPRYPTLIQIMQASKKPIEELDGEEIAPWGSSGRVEVVSMLSQPSTRKHVMIEGSPDEAAAKLVEALSKEGVLK
ncbi:MAG: electron transfer flavoprotein subunit beta/FixA family protein [Nitrososphaerota archaeon]|nr:electron transfer flavoprotein subunit beta/FixA family protein [Nitrososphaerota archaeon]MDG6957641.1 electron transfer flavoprotein subunit beta/FixA family protein [Nitrososphaerota archaeon]MDG6959696.1 electron transfer flavoprotein subunit beta/FixA family protein [Nitrososphaerota archaeon]MDG6968104.1 electron transfer flavoprotein subunit beta/FixA family protein [Nitrososphaerota archaeon]MDG6968970.1 electron transfer flavoprotein subunit beta/FixA family protein [Nitrososphaerot